MSSPLHILMVAAENGALPGAKVGGIGDVVRDAPPALAALPEEIEVDIVLPSYGFLQAVDGAENRAQYEVAFGGSTEQVELYEVPGQNAVPRVRHFVVHRPGMARETIYFRDPPETPFATDATKFARFCAAVAEGLKRQHFGAVTHLHLHDWHAAFLLLLIRYDENFASLRALKSVYTIHNLGLQGIRPFRGHASSMETWYPSLMSDSIVAEVRDPEYDDCLNPTAVAIGFAGRVHAVSPSYCDEILKPTEPKLGYYGGERLETHLQLADQERRLFGILNGCTYDEPRVMPPRDAGSYGELLDVLYAAASRWSAKAPSARHDLALARLEALRRDASARPATIVTMVSRLVDQKAIVMRFPKKARALDVLLAGLGDDDLLVVLGTGDPLLENFMFEESRKFRNFLFLSGYDERAANALYANGDLFLMPSSYEPCGISQMMAMRDGQPCVVHAVGGLKDTVADGESGFCYEGDDFNGQGENFVRTVFRALKLRRDKPAEFERIRTAAFEKRFLWSDSVRQYVDQLYSDGTGPLLKRS